MGMANLAAPSVRRSAQRRRPKGHATELSRNCAGVPFFFKHTQQTIEPELHLRLNKARALRSTYKIRDAHVIQYACISFSKYVLSLIAE
jgi:hypothetical protein